MLITKLKQNSFIFRYEGGDGTKQYSEGKQIIIDDEAGGSVSGGFSYRVT